MKLITLIVTMIIIRLNNSENDNENKRSNNKTSNDNSNNNILKDGRNDRLVKKKTQNKKLIRFINQKKYFIESYKDYTENNLKQRLEEKNKKTFEYIILEQIDEKE